MDHLSRSIRNLLVLLAALLAVVAAISLTGENAGQADEHMFRLPADVVADEVVMISRQDSVRLTAGPSGWSIADSVRAGQDRVRVFFAAIERMKPGRAPGLRLRDSLEAVMHTTGVQVTIRSGGENILAFSALGDEARQETWLSLSDGSEIRRMSIPGYSTYLMDIFSASADAWRDTRLFDLNWRNFSGYSAHFPGRTGFDFTVEQQQGVFGVNGISTDTARLNSYLDAVSLMSAESVKVPSTEELTPLLNTPVEVNLQVREVSGSIYSVTVLSSGVLLVQPRPGRYFFAEVNPAQRRILLLPRPHFQRQN